MRRSSSWLFEPAYEISRTIIGGAPVAMSPSLEKKVNLKQERALTLLANFIKSLGQGRGATVQIALARSQDGKRFLVTGLNSTAKWTQAQLDKLGNLGINIAPQKLPELKRKDGEGTIHAEQNIASYLKTYGLRGERWSCAVVGTEGSYICKDCQSLIRNYMGGFIEPGIKLSKCPDRPYKKYKKT